MTVLIEMISISCMILIICVGSDANPLVIRDQIGAKESRGQHYALRRLDCQVFCKKTGFSGYVGGCQCGFTLFANKRSLHNDDNIGSFYSSSGSKVNRSNGNMYSNNIGSSGSAPNELDLPSDDQSRYDWTHFAYPHLKRLSYSLM